MILSDELILEDVCFTGDAKTVDKLISNGVKVNKRTCNAGLRDRIHRLLADGRKEQHELMAHHPFPLQTLCQLHIENRKVREEYCLKRQQTQ